MENEPVDVERLVRVYTRIGATLKQEKDAFDARESALKAQQSVIAAALKDVMKNQHVESMRTALGVVTLKTTRRYYAQDWDAMYAFIQEHAMPQLLEKRIAQRNMATYLDANPDVVPPGLNSISELTVSVTKPRS